MKMRKIKFRGKSEDTGKYVYGDLCNISSVISTPSIINEHGHRIFVEPDSVAQLIGVDKNGNEVYEGDEIKSCFGMSYYANFHHYGGIIDGTFTFVQTHITNNEENEMNFGHDD